MTYQNNNVKLTNEAILSPCIGICQLDTFGLCQGCLRTGDEIARWTQMSPAERQHIMQVTLVDRERRFGS